MTDKILFWNPGSNNVGQKILYRVVGTTTWSESPMLSHSANMYVLSGTDNVLYECKVLTTCANSVTPIESPIIKTFLTSGLSWTITTLNSTSIMISWNFPSITHLGQLTVGIYLGNTLIETQTFPATQSNSYVFTGLTPSTGYTVLYGSTFTEQTYPENPYTIGLVNYLTPTQSLTEYKRLFNIQTY